MNDGNQLSLHNSVDSRFLFFLRSFYCFKNLQLFSQFLYFAVKRSGSAFHSGHDLEKLINVIAVFGGVTDARQVHLHLRDRPFQITNSGELIKDRLAVLIVRRCFALLIHRMSGDLGFRVLSVYCFRRVLGKT